MLIRAALALFVLAHAPAAGAYRVGTDVVYVGVNGEPPDRPSIQYYDTATRRLGTLDYVSEQLYRTDEQPGLTFDLNTPVASVLEKPFVITDRGGRLGASLWCARGAKRRPTMVLIEGADDADRRLGFLIPYFVAHGMNVVTYDQRGTGLSTGDWRYAGPEAKAEDTIALLTHVESDSAVDPQRIGAWAASNGGWVAPIVATRFPLAFMILKSASSGTIEDNVLYEIEQELREKGKFTSAQVQDALTFERILFASLRTNANWGAAAGGLKVAQAQPWFPYMRIPPGMTLPPPAPMLDGLRASLIFNPLSTLERVRTPTLAIFGALDRNVDAADSAAGFRSAFARAGMRDLTIVTLPGADHTFVRSASGYEDAPLEPLRFVRGYPETMMRWLVARDFAAAAFDFPLTK
jgi:alpha-beta hydrolase superfamily lysophospholipase